MSTSQLKDYYNLLNVNRLSTNKEIKDSFLKLSKVYHPDNKLTGSHAKFVQLKEAYDAIKDGPPATSPTSTSTYGNYGTSAPNSTYDYENVDYTHRAHARYRQYYRDYPRHESPFGNSQFGGPYRHSSTPFEDLMRDREYRRRMAQETRFTKNAGRPLVHMTIFFSAVAWIIIYSCFLVLWDTRNEQKRRGLFKFHNKNYNDYVAFQDYADRRRELVGIQKSKRQTADEIRDELLQGTSSAAQINTTTAAATGDIHTLDHDSDELKHKPRQARYSSSKIESRTLPMPPSVRIVEVKKDDKYIDDDVEPLRHRAT